jgi:hypothetical protein
VHTIKPLPVLKPVEDYSNVIHEDISDEVVKERAVLFTKEQNMLLYHYRKKALANAPLTRKGKQRTSVPSDVVAYLMLTELSRDEFPLELLNKRVLTTRVSHRSFQSITDDHYNRWIKDSHGNPKRKRDEEDVEEEEEEEDV